MGLRDLGYKAYEGERRKAETNTWVLMRHGLRRAWGSWFVKATAFLSWFPPMLFLAIVGFLLWQASQAPEQGAAASIDTQFTTAVRWLYIVQFWLFVTMISAGAGATVIAEDRTFGAFQFYFAKPVTPVQYLAGRLAAVALWCFAVTFIPALLLVIEGIWLAPPQLRMERGGLLLSALLFSALIAIVMSATSIGISALSRSRAMTMSAWAMVLLIPHTIGVLVETITTSPWLLLASIPRLLDVAGNELFKIEVDASQLRWYHVIPALTVIVALSLTAAYRRIREAEVIT